MLKAMRTLCTFAWAIMTVVVLARLNRPDPAYLDLVLDQVQADYVEDEGTNRVLAGLHLQLRSHWGTGKTHLLLRISADSPNVDPVPGYRGVRGANHITARELERALREGHLRLITMHADSNKKHVGRFWAGRRGRLQERRIDDDGKLLLNAESEHDYLLAVHGESVSLPDGEHETFVEVKGVPRVLIRTTVSGERGRIVGVRAWEVTTSGDEDTHA